MFEYRILGSVLVRKMIKNIINIVGKYYHHTKKLIIYKTIILFEYIETNI